MSELFDAIASPWNLAWVLLLFGFAPGFTLRQFVRLYPQDDPRRRELVAELYAVPRVMRLLWVVEQIEVAAAEGPRARRLKRLRAKRAQHEPQRSPLPSQQGQFAPQIDIGHNYSAPPGWRPATTSAGQTWPPEDWRHTTRLGNEHGVGESPAGPAPNS